MSNPVRIPRLNTNDDQVRIVSISAVVGDTVEAGQVLAEVESDKATVVVEADRPGYVRAVCHAAGALARVGEVLVWISDSPDAEIPEPSDDEASDDIQQDRGRPTAGALALARKYSLDTDSVPISGTRLTVSDVEAYLARRDAAQTEPSLRRATAPEASGRLEQLTPQAAAMARFVGWHAREAVPAYLEIAYDVSPWESFAESFRAEHDLLSSPLVGLMAYQLARQAARNPYVNATIADGKRYVYNEVNLGFTIHASNGVFLPVIRGADKMTRLDFVRTFTQFHRKTLRGRLGPADLGGATIAITSAARWPVRRHIPVLPPHVSLIVAHSAGRDGEATLGATYDHRLLDGATAVSVLSDLAKPD